LRLGATAVVDTSGVAVYGKPNDSGFLFGSVLGGGSVSLVANRGSVVTEAGSLIDISRTAAPIDILAAQGGGWDRSNVASAAGALTIKARETIALDGALDAHAGKGDTGTASGGSVDIELSRAGSQVPGAPDAPRVIRLTQADQPAQ